MKKGDLFIYIAALLLALLPLMTLLSPVQEATRAVVRIDGKIVHTFLLDADAEKTFSSAAGENTVQVKEGKVRILAADCPDKTCVSMGGISRANQVLVCLPHHLTVEIDGADDDAPDAVTQ